MKKDFYYLSPFVLIPVWVFFINLVDKWDLSIIPYIFIGGLLLLTALIGWFTPAQKKMDLRITFFVPLAFFLTMFIGAFFDTGTCSGEPRLDLGEAFEMSIRFWFIYVFMALITFLVSFVKIKISQKNLKKD
ncbi:MAG: hypothetical protein J6S14_19320 [Clostridia bacterium]|nr:hypothetical protein [Clostridia bacterium]